MLRDNMINNSKIPVKDYKVLVNCMTYNQSKYIEDALNGFVMQKTDFPFVCLVMDDASTDGEQDVIKAWMDRECDMAKVERYDVLESEVFVVPHKNNSSCTMAFYFLKENLHGTGKKTPLINHWREHCEYEALCEGDDYWIAPEKLKMQVAILDDNDGISLCSTAVVINGVGGFKRKTRYPTSCVVPLKDILSNGGGFLTTVTYLYRINKEIMNKPSFWENCHVGDYPLAIFCGLIGQVLYINEFTSCYRYGIGWTKHFYELPIKERISRWKSEIDMLNGFNEFSGKKYNQVFCSSIINFLFITIILDNYENRELFKDFHKYLHPSNLKEMLKVIVIKYKYAGALYHLVMKLVW